MHLPTSSRRIPNYHHYKLKNLAVVRLNGGDHYSGRRYQRLLQPLLDREPQAFLLSPQESERWRLEHRPPASLC